MWDLLVSVPDHCLSFLLYNTDYFICKCTSIKGLGLHGLSKYYQDSISSLVR